VDSRKTILWSRSADTCTDKSAQQRDGTPKIHHTYCCPAPSHQPEASITSHKYWILI